MQIPKGLKALFDKRLVGIISTNGKDGYPHSVPVWITLVEGKIYFSTYHDSQKAKNLTNNQRSGLTVVDTPGGPYIHLLTNATIRTKDEFSKYKEIIEIIMRKYVPQEKVRQFTDDRMQNPKRILVELDVVRILKNPFTTNNPDENT